MEPATPTIPRAIVYIDGFNWYYGIFKHFPSLKWLNIRSFFEALRNNEKVVKVKFFSALLDPSLGHLAASHQRQTEYHRALKTLPDVKVILGYYQPREVECRGSCKQKYETPEEKKTDVNIAVNLLDDAFANRADRVVIVSGDSDLQPAVMWLLNNAPNIAVTVYIPATLEEQKKRRIDSYRNTKVDCRFLPLGDLPNHILPDIIHPSDGSSVIERPATWR